MRSIIISGSDKKYFSLLYNLCNHLKKKNILKKSDLGLFDVGLNRDQNKKLLNFTKKIIKPEWDCEINFDTTEWKKLLVVRPFLKKYFPNYDLYIWMDADTIPLSDNFLREINLLKNKDVFICNEYDDCYLNNKRDSTYKKIFKSYYEIKGWVHKNNMKYLGKTIADNLLGKPLFNAGFYALRSRSVIWEKWQKVYSNIILNSKDDYCLSMDQASLNQILYQNLKKVHVMNSKYNWLVKNSLPYVYKKNLCKPSFPYEKIEILHFTCFDIKKKINLYNVNKNELYKKSFKTILKIK